MTPKEKQFIGRVVAIVDNREQDPLDLMSHGLMIKLEGLEFGDYSLHYPDMRRLVCVERKTLNDLVQCCGRERKRFEKLVTAMRGFKYRLVVVEGDYNDIVQGNYKGRMNPESIQHTITKWSSWNIPIQFVGTHENAAEYVADYLKRIALQIFHFCKNDLGV